MIRQICKALGDRVILKGQRTEARITAKTHTFIRTVAFSAQFSCPPYSPVKTVHIASTFSYKYCRKASHLLKPVVLHVEATALINAYTRTTRRVVRQLLLHMSEAGSFHTVFYEVFLIQETVSIYER
jgi:hypothetical protein